MSREVHVRFWESVGLRCPALLTLDGTLDARERAQAWAIERMLEDHLSWALSHIRWGIPENFDKGPAHFFDTAPEAVRATVREQARTKVSERLWAQGMGRHKPEEITELGGRSLAALSAMLADKPYLMGDRPCGADATAFGMLASVLTPFFDSPLRRKAESFPNLVAYADRMAGRYYPEDSWGSDEKTVTPVQGAIEQAEAGQGIAA
jgi:glutathione S-transferase